MDKAFLERCLRKGISEKKIAKITGYSKSDVGYWVDKYGLRDINRFKKKPPYSFGKIDTKGKAYTLGFMLCDASILKNNTVEFRCALRDKSVLEFIAKVVDGNVSEYLHFDKSKRKFPNASITKRIKDVLKFVGGLRKEDRHYPVIRDDLEKYMALGLFDADGCITWGRRKDKNRIWQKVSFTSQRKILEGLQKFLLNKVGISSVIRQKGNEKCYVLEFANRKNVIKFCDYIYSDDEFVVLKRKYLKYNALRLELEENGEIEKAS